MATVHPQHSQTAPTIARAAERARPPWFIQLIVVLTASVALIGGQSMNSATPRAGAAPALPDATEPLPPTDSFYDRPPDLDAASPGQILRSRPVQVRALQLVPVAVDAWQLLYRTTDADGNPDATVTTVMIPRGGSPKKLLSYQAATDATLRQCAPSYSLVNGGPIDLSAPIGPVTFSLPGAELVLAASGLAQGWAVAMPDHGGSDSRFLTPRQPGYAVLDGIRAVQAFEPTGLDPQSPVALWGYSGGAIASSWAVEEQPEYASELNLVGAAFGAPERDLEASLRSSNGSLLAGLIPIALASIAKDSSDFAAALDPFLTDDGRRIVGETRNHCLAQNVLANTWYDYRHSLNAPLDTVLADPTIERAIAERGISGRAPSVPTYIYNGVTEEVAPISGTDKLVQSYCDRGASVTYRREELPPAIPPQIYTTHGTVAVTGAPGAFDWLRQRLDGAPATTGCDIKTVPSSLLEAPSLRALGPAVSAALTTLLGLPPA